MAKTTVEQMNDLKEEALKKKNETVDKHADELDAKDKETVVNIPNKVVTERNHGRTHKSPIDDNDPSTL